MMRWVCWWFMTVKMRLWQFSLAPYLRSDVCTLTFFCKETGPEWSLETALHVCISNKLLVIVCGVCAGVRMSPLKFFFMRARMCVFTYLVFKRGPWFDLWGCLMGMHVCGLCVCLCVSFRLCHPSRASVYLADGQRGANVDFFVKAVRFTPPRYMFNDQQLSSAVNHGKERSGWALSAKESLIANHTQRYLWGISKGHCDYKQWINWVSTSLGSPGQVFVCSEKTDTPPQEVCQSPAHIQSSFQGSILKIWAKGTIISGFGNRNRCFQHGFMQPHVSWPCLTCQHQFASVKEPNCRVEDKDGDVQGSNENVC